MVNLTLIRNRVGLDSLNSRSIAWQGSVSLRPPQLLGTSLELLDGRGVPDSASYAVLELLNGRVPLSLRLRNFAVLLLS